jgi:hypothetical protein
MLRKEARLILSSQLYVPSLLFDLPRISAVEIIKVTKSLKEIEIQFKTSSLNIMILDLIGNKILFCDNAFENLTGQGIPNSNVLVYGLPSVILTLPLLFVNETFWKTNQLLFGLSRHALSIWCRIRGQLDKNTQDHLYRLLKTI